VIEVTDEMVKTIDSDRLKVAQFFSDISRNAGKVSFKITYTNTDGNREIDQRFQDFCFRHTNNEYLAGISKLLDCFKAFEDKTALEVFAMSIESRVKALEEKTEKEAATQRKVVKTIGVG
jgi:hypothetical protein